MTRFNITLSDGVELVFNAINHAFGGEIFVPQIPSYRIIDIAEAIGPNCTHKIVGIRQGEKLHEEMITTSDNPNTLELNNNFIIIGAQSQKIRKHYIEVLKAKEVHKEFSYNSFNNPDYINVDQIRALIKNEIDPNFSPY